MKKKKQVKAFYIICSKVMSKNVAKCLLDTLKNNILSQIITPNLSKWHKANLKRGSTPCNVSVASHKELTNFRQLQKIKNRKESKKSGLEEKRERDRKKEVERDRRKGR